MMSQGVRFTLSDDSHGPSDVGMHYDKLVVYVQEMGITDVFYLQPVEIGDSNIMSIPTASLTNK
jgi:histidinol-phosphatase (PHP family)